MPFLCDNFFLNILYKTNWFIHNKSYLFYW